MKQPKFNTENIPSNPRFIICDCPYYYEARIGVNELIKDLKNSGMSDRELFGAYTERVKTLIMDNKQWKLKSIPFEVYTSKIPVLSFITRER